MSDLNVILLVSSLPIIVIGIVWIMVRTYSSRLSRIDEELRAITVVLSEIPKETSLQEYMFNQDQRLRSIEEKLDMHPDLDMLQQYIQDHTLQMHTMISMLEQGSKTKLTKADFENALRVTNNSLMKVLWSLRFDEDKYSEITAVTGNRFSELGKEKVKSNTKNSEKDREALEDTKSMKAILKDNDDNYGAMLKYMQRTGKDGSNALDVLGKAKRMHNR